MSLGLNLGKAERGVGLGQPLLPLGGPSCWAPVSTEQRVQGRAPGLLSLLRPPQSLRDRDSAPDVSEPRVITTWRKVLELTREMLGSSTALHTLSPQGQGSRRLGSSLCCRALPTALPHCTGAASSARSHPPLLPLFGLLCIRTTSE